MLGQGQDELHVASPLASWPSFTPGSSKDKRGCLAPLAYGAGLCCTAATQNTVYGKSQTVLAKSPGNPHALLQPGRRKDLADDSIRASADTSEQVRGLARVIAIYDLTNEGLLPHLGVSPSPDTLPPKGTLSSGQQPLRNPLMHKGLALLKRVDHNWRMMIGYARVSTDDQSLALQLDALMAAGCGEVFQDTASGASTSRKGLCDALARCNADDVLTVWKLDRLGRSLLDLVGLVEELKGRGVGLKVLTGAGASIDTTKPEGRLFFAMFAAMAEFERELIRERTRAGMTAAKKRGRHVGRPRKLTPERLAHARTLIEDGRERADVAGLLGVGTSTLRRALRT